MSDRKLPPSPFPAEDDDSIIFEKKPEASAFERAAQELTSAREAVRLQMENERFFDVEFCIKNHKVWWSHSQSEIPAHALADLIIEAVQRLPTEAIEYKPRTAVIADLATKQVTYDRYVRFNWSDQKIQTSLSPNEGEIFLSVMSALVEDLRRKAQIITGGTN